MRTYGKITRQWKSAFTIKPARICTAWSCCHEVVDSVRFKPCCHVTSFPGPNRLIYTCAYNFYRSVTYLSFHWFHWISSISDSENLNFVFVGIFSQISSMGKLFSSSCFMKTFPFNISFQLFLFDADSSKEQKFTPSVNQGTAYWSTRLLHRSLGRQKSRGN